jgi:inhibitor of cysteine peptidase
MAVSTIQSFYQLQGETMNKTYGLLIMALVLFLSLSPVFAAQSFSIDFRNATGRASQNAVHPNTIEFLEQDNGRACTIYPGQELSIRLPSNPSTGYLWEVAANDSAVLRQKGESVFDADNNWPGSGGQVIFRFVASGVGSVRLTLVYHRPWETEIPPIKVFEIDLSVTPGKRTEAVPMSSHLWPASGNQVSKLYLDIYR